MKYVSGKQYPHFRFQVSGFRFQVLGFRSPVAGCRLLWE